jgi:hypothetical protein
MLDAKSLFFENIHTHRFLSDILRECVLRKPSLFLDVLRGEVDDGGIDLILSSGKVTRHIQLKARAETIPPRPYAISERLLTQPGGCVIWIRYEKLTLFPIDYYALIGKPKQRPPAMPAFKPSKNKKGLPRVGYFDVPMRRANKSKLSLTALCKLLFP